MSQKNSQGIVVSFHHAIHAARFVQMVFKCLRKKKSRVRFVCNGKAEEAEKLLSLDWDENLAESNKGLFRPGAIAEGVKRAAER